MVMVNDFPGAVSQFCLLIADNTKIRSGIVQKGDIQADIFAVYAWAGRNYMLLNATKMQYIHNGGYPPNTRIISDYSRPHIPILLTNLARDLGIMIDSFV